MPKPKHINRRKFLSYSAYTLIGGSYLNADNNVPIDMKDSYQIEESIIINSPIKKTFSYITHFEQASNISKHLNNIKILKKGTPDIGLQYTRQLSIHGISQDQTVTVTEYEINNLYTTSTTLFGITVNYTYRFTTINDRQVKITLTKTALIDGFLDNMTKPIIKHQLTRPEHDGQHLSTLKRAVETA